MAAVTNDDVDTFDEDVEKLKNPYGTENLLGSGTYAATYKCVVGEDVMAVKKFFLNKENEKDRNFSWRVLGNERTILASFQPHDNIVNFYRCEDNFLYMEFLGDQHMGTWWRTHKEHNSDAWRNETLKQILRCLCSALIFLKENGVIHFDIKEDNIVLRNNDPSRAVLIDFGRSVQMDGDCIYDQIWDTDGPPCGAYCCQPPEILNILFRYSHRRPPMINSFDTAVDIYSVGVLLFYKFCDEYPNGFFISESRYIAPLLQNVSKREWASNETFARMEMRRIVTYMLLENHYERPDAQEILTRLTLLTASKTPVPVVWSEDEGEPVVWSEDEGEE